VERTALWEILLKISCPTDFVTIICSFHEGTWASVIENCEVSPDFEVTNGTKQGCGLAPLLNVIFFSMMLRVAFLDCNLGIPICYRTDGDLFDLRRLQAVTKVQTAIIRDLLFADDCLLVAHTATALQTLFTQFINSAKRFGLTVSLKKTETMSQSYPLSPASTVTVMAGESQLAPVNRFCYLGSYLSNTISVDIDINSHLAKAGDAFGKLQRRLWGEYSIALLMKTAVYQAVVLSMLLYGCESWVLCRHSVRRLDEFHI